MAKPSPVNWKIIHKFLQYIGCEYKRKKGSHRVYIREGLKRPIILPEHSKDIPVFIIKNILRTLGISNEQYLSILEKI